MGLSNLQRIALFPRVRARFTPAENVILKSLEKGDRTLPDLVEEYCRGMHDGGPRTATRSIRQMIHRLRKKGVAIGYYAVYRLEGDEP